MDGTDLPGGSEEPDNKKEGQEGPDPIPRTAFYEHLRYGHGVKDVPDDEADAWRLHQRLHGR